MKHFQFPTIRLAAVLIASLGTSTLAQENTGPSTNIAWTIETLNLLRSGDPERGATLNLDLECATCHGATGVSENDTWPSLSGQPAGYTYKILRDYRDQKLSGTQRGELMAYVVEEMTDQDMVDLASYYAQNKLPPARQPFMHDAVEYLDLLGDPERLIPPCSVCHGKNGKGDFPDFPALAGQSPEYLTRSMMDFKAGRRGNDVYSRMRLISARLTDKEIQALANYFASISLSTSNE